MNEVLSIALTILSGVALGVMFFGGLWWTVEKGISSKRPGLLFFGSFLLRISIALAGFYFVGNGNWHRIIECLIGFVLARTIINLLSRPRRIKSHRVQGGSHEPQS